MRTSQVRECFRLLTKAFFFNSTVSFSNQSRTAKSDNPYILISSGNTKRTMFSSDTLEDGIDIKAYPSKLELTLDLFTNGTEVRNPADNKVYGYEDTSAEELLSFLDFVGSRFVKEWSHSLDISIVPEGDVISLTGIVNDTNYEYRARQTFTVCFTQKSIGYRACLSESSIRYSTGGLDTNNNAIFTADDPVARAKTMLDTFISGGTTEVKIPDFTSISDTEHISIVPVLERSSCRTGTNEQLEVIASVESGYFTDADITIEQETEDS